MIKFIYNILWLLLLTNCAKEKAKITDPYLDDSLVKLNNYENDINRMYEKSKSFHGNILVKKQNLDNKLNNLFYIPLDYPKAISKEDSANYHEVIDLLHDIIKLNNDEDLHKQADIISKSSTIEGIKYAYNENIKAKVDYIKKIAKVILDIEKQNTAIKNNIINDNELIDKKLAHALDKISSFSYGKSALTDLIKKIPNIETIKDINHIMNDDRFIDLAKDLRHDERHGEKILTNQAKLKDMVIGDDGIINKAKNIITDLANKIAYVKDNLSDDHLNALIYELDNIFMVKDFSDLIKTFMTPALEVRKNSYKDLFTPPSPVSGSPPPGGGPPIPPPAPGSGPPGVVPPAPPPPGAGPASGGLTKDPKSAVDQFLLALNGIKDNKVDIFANKVKLNIRNILSLLKASITTKMINDIDNVNTTLKLNYTKLADHLYPYDVDNIKVLLLSQVKDDEDKLAKNWDSIAKLIHPNINKLINVAQKNIIKKRLLVLNNYINNITHIKDVDNKINDIQKTRTKTELITNCNELKGFEVLTYINEKTCDKISDDLRELIPDDPEELKKVPVQKILDALSKVKTSILEKYQTLRDDLSLSKNKSAFMAALSKFNNILKNDKKIALASLPNDDDYNIDNLVNVIIDILKKYKIAAGKDNITYEEVIDNINNYVFAAMSEEDINTLGDKIKASSKDKLKVSLAAVLSDDSYRNLANLFLPKKSDEIITAIKDITEANLKDIKDSLVLWDNAFDDTSSKDALLALAQHLKDPLANKIRDISRKNDDVLSLEKRLDLIKDTLNKELHYKNLKKIAELDPNDIDNIVLKKPLDIGLAEQIDNLPKFLKASLLSAGDINTVMAEFKASLTESLQALYHKHPYYEDDNLRQPIDVNSIINAFTLLFLHPLEVLNKLTLDGNDDDKIIEVNKLFDKPSLSFYIVKFYKFKSIIGKDKDNNDYDIIIKLSDILDKINSATTTSSELIKIKNIIESWLK